MAPALARPMAVTIAAVLSVLGFLDRLGGASMPPQIVLVFGVILGVASSPAVAGLWMLRR